MPADTHAFYYMCFLGLAHCGDGPFGEAVIQARRTMALNHRFAANLRVLAASLAALNRFEEAGAATIPERAKARARKK